MKHLKLFFALFAMLALGVGNAWGETTTYVMYPDGGSTFNTEWNKTSRIARQTYASKVVAQMMKLNNGVYGEITSKNTVANINAISVKCTANTAQKLTLYYSTDNSQWTELSTTSISKNTSSYSDYDIDIAGIPATAYIKFRAETNSIYLYSITISTSEVATPDPVDPTVTFSNGNYTVGQTLDLSTLWTSNSDGAVTYTVKTDGGTGATINGTSFTATAAGTCEIKASQAATSAYNAIEKTATITVTAPTPATVTLSEAGQEKTVEGKYVGNSYELPLTSTQTCGTKTFVGWSTVEIATPGDKPTSNFYEPGATVTLSAEQTFYAVYATGSGTPETWEKTTSVAVGDLVVIAQVDDGTKEMTGLGKTPETDNNNYGTGTDFTTNPNGTLVWTVEEGNAPGQFSFNNGSYYLNLGSNSNYLSYSATKDANSSWTVSTEDERAVVANATYDSRKIMWNKSNTRFASYSKNHGNNSGQYYYHIVFYKKSGGISYSDYTTSCSGSTEPVVSLTDEQLNWSATSATALKGADNNAFPTLTNSITVPVTYSSSNTSVATIAADGTITLVAPGTTTISAIFAGGKVGGTTYAAKTVSYTMTVKQLVSCAEIYNLADEATFVLKDFVVTYVNGTYTYIKDNEGGYGLIFTNSGEYGLKAGEQVASGKFEGKKDTYYGLVEIIPTTEVGDLGATSGTAPEPEVMTNTPTNADINKYVKFENVSFKYTNLNDTYKTNSGKLEGQTEYNIAFYNKFTSNVTFDTSKKYDVVGVVSIKDDAIEVYFISAEEVAEPTLNLTTTPIDFGKVAINSTNESTLQLSGSLLTKDITLSVEGDSYFTVSANSITPSEGSVNETITITYKPTVEGTHTATLKITSDELTEQTITLTGNAVEEYTVHFYVNGEEQTDLAKKVLSGNTLEDLPTATSCDLLNYPTFAGWTSAEIDGTTDVKPTMLDLSTPITSDCNYYAVFAKGTTSSGTANTSYELVILPSDFTTSYNERSFTATANEVDGEGTLEVSLTSAGVMKNTDASKGNPIQFRKKSSSTSPGTIYNTTNLEQINSISYAEGTNNIASTIIGASQQPTEQEDGKGFFMITNGTSVSYIPSITINFTKTSVSEITTYEYITSCAVVVPTCEITYDFAGGEGECTTEIVEEGAEYTLCATAPTKTGHTFLNWKDQHGTEYAAGATINSVTEDLTLTAQWQVNSYSVTWMSLGEEVLVNSTNYNTQPTKPATDPAYTCGTGKEFVGWTTQEIDGVGVPANLYTDEFPVVTEAITYYAVFAGKSAEASITTNTLTITENLGQYGPGTMTDDQGATWNYYAGGSSADLTVNLRNNSGEVSYLASPKFAGTVQSITAHIKNGSSSTRKVYLRSSAEASPSGGDLGETSIDGNNNSNVALVIADGKSFDQFYIQVSGGLQFKDIVVTSGIAAGAYVDFITSCDAVTASISVENITMEVGENKTITATVEPAEAEVTYSIKENAENAISLSGNTITALKEGTATITATVAEGATYLGNSVDFTVTVKAPEQALTEWVLTSLADITINDLVVITMTKGETTWAMTNDNGTSAPVASPVTLSADALASEPADNLKWVVENESGNITIYPYGGYESWLYCTDINKGVKVGDNANKIFTIDAESGYLKHEGTSRYIGVYNAQDWRCYTTTTENTAGQTLAFFVKKNANDVLPGTGEEPGDDPVVPTPTINPTATFVFNTAEGLNDLGITYPITAVEGTEGAYKTDFEDGANYTQDDITMTTTNGGTPTRVWLNENGLDLRVHKGATLTFSVPAEHQISKIVFDGSNIGHLLVNENAVSGNAWTGSAQTITFTAKSDASTIKINTIAFVVEYTRNVTNKYGSICLPYASASTSGAYFYEVVGTGTENSKPAVYLASVNTLKAGVPYIFEKTANTIKVVYSSEKEDTPQNANGLIGTFEETTVPDGAYILYNDAFRTNEPAGSLNKIRSYRAYLDLSAVEGGAPQQMPGRRYIGLDVHGENGTTGLDNIMTTEAPAKVIVNGQLIIIRDGVKYNVQGQKL